MDTEKIDFRKEVHRAREVKRMEDILDDADIRIDFAGGFEASYIEGIGPYGAPGKELYSRDIVLLMPLEGRLSHEMIDPSDEYQHRKARHCAPGRPEMERHYTELSQEFIGGSWATCAPRMDIIHLCPKKGPIIIVAHSREFVEKYEK
ncbi:hypothetical protein GOV10_06520 [Candidatus Woesearchaeota archaeon]|nr:hypothetical protein [Candidatus Woesearchaeota archaeon]